MHIISTNIIVQYQVVPIANVVKQKMFWQFSTCVHKWVIYFTSYLKQTSTDFVQMSYLEASYSNKYSQIKKQNSFHNNRENKSIYVHISGENSGCLLQKICFLEIFSTEVSINWYNIWLGIVFDK